MLKDATFAGTGSGMQNDVMHQPVSNLPREFTQLPVLCLFVCCS